MRLSVHFDTPLRWLQKLYDTGVEKARGNILDFGGRRVIIEGGGYRKIWLETQPMGGEMFAKYDLDAALNNQLFFMEHQREDGRMPGSIACEDGRVIPQFDKVQGFCFAFPALNMFYWTGSENHDYLRQLRQTLIRFDDYLWRVRDSDGDGCLESWCVFDTGDDNCTRYADAPNYCKEETPPKGFANVPMESSDFMSFSYTARETVAKISHILGETDEAEKWEGLAKNIRKKIREYLWDEEIGACFDRDANNNVIPALTHHTLRAMYWHSLENDMAEKFVKKHLLNPDEFFTPMPLTSIAANNPYFKNAPHNNWSGQPEGLTYQRAIRALENYGFAHLVPVFGKKLLAAVGERGVFTQQFDPFTGAPSEIAHPDRPSSERKQDGYGPTILACLEYIARMHGISLIEGELHFGATAGYETRYQMQWGEREMEVRCDSEQAAVFVNGAEVFTFSADARVVCDLEMNPLRLICTAEKPAIIKFKSKLLEKEKGMLPGESIKL